LAIVASFGKIIPYQYFKIYKRGMINVHPSLLPKYRGPSPIQNSILNGDFETGVTLFVIDNEVDHGPIIGQTKALIDFKDNYESLSIKLAKLGANLINFILPNFLAGKTYIKIQNENLATYTKKFNFQDGYIN
jgi:methionyl-tRNA formyltransferase